MEQVNHAAWTGRTVEDTACFTEADATRLNATLGGGLDVGPDCPLPPLAHWCAFTPTAANDQLGPDGHPRGSDLLPPAPSKRRMWAGGALEFHAPVKIGEPLRRRSSVRSIVPKAGAAGDMLFVTVDHAIYGPRGLAIEERQDIVYLDIPESFCPPKPRDLPGTFVQRWAPDEVQLFRYSALTFNAHRIHYDRTYATTVEHYPDLVVHGPLQAAMLMQVAQQIHGQPPKYFDFRGVHPMFVGQPSEITVQEDIAALNLWTGQGGHQCMQATAIWEGTQ